MNLFLKALFVHILRRINLYVVCTPQVHPDIVSVLCKICPELLEDVFDGMLWHSATVEANDLVRVNYYIRELLGDPDSYPDAWDTPLGVLALRGPTSIFEHPLVTKVRCRA